MPRQSYISIEEAARQLAGQPTATITLQLRDIETHMAGLRRSGCVVSLTEYGKFYRARQILLGVLDRRTGE